MNIKTIEDKSGRKYFQVYPFAYQDVTNEEALRIAQLEKFKKDRLAVHDVVESALKNVTKK